MDVGERLDDLFQPDPAQEPGQQHEAEQNLGDANQLLAVGANEFAHNGWIIAQVEAARDYAADGRTGCTHNEVVSPLVPLFGYFAVF